MHTYSKLAAAAALALGGAAHAQLVGAYSFPFSDSGGFTTGDLPYAPTGVADGLSVSDLSAGSGLASPSNPKPGLRLRSLTPSSPDNDGVILPGDYVAALAGGDFFEFTLGLVGDGLSYDVDDVLLNFYGREPVDFGVALFSSLDGYTTALDAEIYTGTADADLNPNPNSPGQALFQQLELDADLTGLAADTTFRLALVVDRGTFSPGGNIEFFAGSVSDANGDLGLEIDGNVTLIPEPAAASALGLVSLLGLRRRR
jgi:hypothetical protein